MEWSRLKRVYEAPAQGWVLAYLRTEVLFKQYHSMEEIREYIQQGEILELHLFDQEKEYRAIVSQSKRYPSGIVETIADFRLDAETTYNETIYLEATYQKLGKEIQMCNHLKYDTNGMLEVDNYRLVMKEG